jgi:hypothetical protein
VIGIGVGACSAIAGLAAHESVAHRLGRSAVLSVVLMLLPQLVLAGWGVVVGDAVRGAGLGLLLANVLGLLGGALLFAAVFLSER